MGHHLRRRNPAEVKGTTVSKCATRATDVYQTDNPISTSSEQSLGPNFRNHEHIDLIQEEL
jgi:hypothetical protein